MPKQDDLKKEMRDAKAAMEKTAGDLAKDVRRLVDPRWWTRTHPWASLATAATAGFATAASVVPPKNGKPHEAPETDARQPAPEATTAAKTRHASEARKVESAFGLGFVIKELWLLARPMLGSMLAAFMSGNTESAEHNGYDGAHAASESASSNPGSEPHS